MKHSGGLGSFPCMQNPPTPTFDPSQPRSQCLSLPALKSVLGVGGEGRHEYRRSPVAAFRGRFCNWYSAGCGIFQLLAGKHRAVVNHSNAAVRVISARELGRDMGTCSCGPPPPPQEPRRAISESLHFMLKGRGPGPLASESTGVRATFVLVVESTERGCTGPGPSTLEMWPPS